MIDSKVRTFRVEWSGTGIVVVPSGLRRCITRWLPRWRACSKPFAWRIAQTASPDRTASLPNRDLDMRNVHIATQALGHFRRIGALEEQLQRLD